MSSGTRSRLLVLAVVVTVLAVAREVSIRRHMDDLTHWPTPEGHPNGAR